MFVYSVATCVNATKKKKGYKKMNQEPTYKTEELARLFMNLKNQGYEAMNLKLITDLIERDGKQVAPPNTVAALKESLEEYGDQTPILWQFYTEDHAQIDSELWKGISEELMQNQEFWEDHHLFMSGWFDSAQKKIEEEGI